MNPALVEILMQLEQAQVAEAKAFVLVTTDAYTGDVINATGPFTQAELALVQAGRDEADWKRHAENDIDAESIAYTVVPLWEPTP